MGATPIEWTDFSINPFRARNKETGKCGHFCVKISPGCKNCYSSRTQPRFGTFPFLAENREKVELFLDESKLREVIARKKPVKFFWCDMTDMFLEDYPDEWIDRCFAAMALTPQHTHQVLTKRPGRMLKWFARWTTKRFTYVRRGVTFEAGEWPYPNIWLGVSVEDQKTADERIPLLLQTPAAVRFVSYEPALAAVDFAKYFDEGLECNYCNRWRGTEETGTPDGNEEDPGFLCPECGEAVAHLPLDELLGWIIVGGESGPGARPFDIQWARNTIKQCKAAGLACFVKQLGAHPQEVAYPQTVTLCETQHWMDSGWTRITDENGQHWRRYYRLKDRKGGDWNEWEPGLRVREFPEVRNAARV